jgi:hypothetical protein
MRKSILLPLLAWFTLSSCAGPSGAPAQSDHAAVETMVAATFQALTQSAPTVPAFAGSPFVLPNLSGTIPEGLASGLVDEVTAEMEFPICANPSCGETPSHHRYVLQEYAHPASLLSARILLFEASEFGGFTAFTPDTLAGLQSLKANPGMIPEDLVNRNFGTRSEYLTFQNGYGVGYFYEPLQGIAPISNDHLFYYFQGLTDDGRYFIAAVLPVSAPFLAVTGDPGAPLPPDAVPFDWQGNGDFDAYYTEVARRIDQADPAAFSPGLDLLKGFIQSLRVTP